MKDENRELLDNLITDRLSGAIHASEDDKRRTLFEEAMKATDRRIEMDRIEADKQENAQKRDQERYLAAREECLKARDSKWNFILDCVKVGTALVVAPVIEAGVKVVYAKIICAFEEEDYFKKTAGKSLSGLFRFRN